MNDYDENAPPPIPNNKMFEELRGRVFGFFALYIFLTIIVFLPLFVWFECRIEVEADEIAVLIKKTGEDLSFGDVMAVGKKQKGIQLEVLSEGRYFKNPYKWGWKIHNITDIPAGKLGVLTRLYGENLPLNKIIAEEGTKGILNDVLLPGKYRLNPYAVQVELFDATTIRPGHVGVVTSLIGKDILNNNIPTEEISTFIVKEGMKGVMPTVLDPGTYYLNPYMFNVIEVNLQSHRFGMSGKDVISFLTLDGFTVTLEGTIEFALARDKAALLTHRVGTVDDIVKKLILPRARGFSRIEGSKHPAIDFIVGETRQKFQNDLESHLKSKCEAWGVEIKTILIRKIIVPDQIASISRDREVAFQNIKKYEQQIQQARSKAELVKQEMLAEQNSERVKAETQRIMAVIKAEKDQEVKIIAARKDLEVSKIYYKSAGFQADAILLEAEGEMDAIRVKNKAEASVVADQVKAFGTGINMARYVFYQKIGPGIYSILSSDEKGGLGAIFGAYLPEGMEVSK